MPRYVILMTILSLALAACNPFKVTDPSDPRFDPDKFDFRDYGRDGLYEVFPVLLPVGTPKEFVDRVLVDAGHATTRPHQNYANRIHYTYVSEGIAYYLHRSRLPVSVIYDQDWRVKQILVGPGRVFKDRDDKGEILKGRSVVSDGGSEGESQANSERVSKLSNFRFDQYSSHEKFAVFAREHFPVGTSRDVIDGVLVQQAGAAFHEGTLKDAPNTPGFGFGADKHKHLSALPPDTKYVTYKYPGKNNKTGWRVYAFYDQQDRLIVMYAYNTLVHNQ